MDIQFKLIVKFQTFANLVFGFYGNFSWSLKNGYSNLFYHHSTRKKKRTGNVFNFIELYWYKFDNLQRRSSTWGISSLSSSALQFA